MYIETYTILTATLLLTHLPRYLTHQLSIHIGPRYLRVSTYLRNARRLCLGFGKEGKRRLRTRLKTRLTTRVMLMQIAKPEKVRMKTKFTSKKTSNFRMRSLSRGRMISTVVPPSLTANLASSLPILPIHGSPTMIPGIIHYFSLAYARHYLPSYATFVIVRLLHSCASAAANDPY